MPIFKVNLDVSLEKSETLYIAAEKKEDIKQELGWPLLLKWMQEPDDSCSVDITDVFPCNNYAYKHDLDISVYVTGIDTTPNVVHNEDVLGVVEGKIVEYYEYEEAMEKRKAAALLAPFPGQLGIPGMAEDVPA